MQQPEISIHPLIGRLQWKYRIYTLFTPLEDRIGIVRIGRREMNLTSFFLEFM